MDENDKIPAAEPKLGLGAWLDNFWYHYKYQTLIAALLIVTAVVSTTQILTREKFDYYMMYAGPQVVALQDLVYIQRGLEAVADDFDGNGEVNVSVDDIVMLSPEERAAAMESDAFINPEAVRSTMTEYYQQIVGGDAIICLLSPYMYEMVHESDGFLPLSEIYTEIPAAVAAAAYDDCGLVLAKTAFGQSFNGIDDLPENTILCIRRLSSMAKLKGEAKTQKRHAASIDLFRRLAEYDPAASAEKESN